MARPRSLEELAALTGESVEELRDWRELGPSPMRATKRWHRTCSSGVLPVQFARRRGVTAEASIFTELPDD